MRWFDGLEKDSIQGYDKLIKAFGARFVTCSRTPKPFNFLLTMSGELYNEICGDNGGI